MEPFKLYRHKDNDSVRFWARPVKKDVSPPLTEEWQTAAMEVEYHYEIRASRNAAFDTEDRPLFLCVPGGTFPAAFFEETYELVENPRVVVPA